MVATLARALVVANRDRLTDGRGQEGREAARDGFAWVLPCRIVARRLVLPGLVGPRLILPVLSTSLGARLLGRAGILAWGILP